MEEAETVALKKLPSQRRSLALFDSIVTAATRAFGEVDYQSTSTSHIAEKAGVSVGSLYQYFPNKNAIVGVIARRIIKHHIDSFAERIARIPQKDPRKVLDESVAHICDLYFSHRRLMRTVFRHADRLDKMPMVAQARRDATNVIYEALKGHAVRDPENLHLSLTLLIHGALGILESSVLDDSTIGKEAAIQAEIRTMACTYIMGSVH